MYGIFPEMNSPVPVFEEDRKRKAASLNTVEGNEMCVCSDHVISKGSRTFSTA